MPRGFARPPTPVPKQRLRLLPDDLLAAGDFLLALLEISVSDGLQVINVVEVNVFQEVHFRLDVARHGDVNE